MPSWIFQAIPEQFDLDGFLKTRPTSVSWLVKQHAGQIAIGDQVFLWQAIGKGSEKNSGILAEGTIIEKPYMREDDPESAPFWTNYDPTPALRVRVRIDRIELARRFERGWLADDPIMTKATIWTRRVGTNFLLTDEQSLRLNALWRKAKMPWDYADTVAGLWAFAATLGKNISRLPGSEVSIAALRTGRVVKGMYNKVLNFRALDPTDARAGLSSTSQMDKFVWSKFQLPEGGLDLTAVSAEFDRLWANEPYAFLPEPPAPESVTGTLEQLLERWRLRSKTREPKPTRTWSTRADFTRDDLVVAIARARATSCEVPNCSHVPWKPANGKLFLEVHHIVPLADGGDDTPENVACICPSHHREAHSGENAAQIQAELLVARQAAKAQ